MTYHNVFAAARSRTLLDRSRKNNRPIGLSLLLMQIALSMRAFRVRPR
jgi:hypothetical protein